MWKTLAALKQYISGSKIRHDLIGRQASAAFVVFYVRHVWPHSCIAENDVNSVIYMCLMLAKYW